MRNAVDGMKTSPHPEEAAKRPSRRTHGAGPGSCELISPLDHERSTPFRQENERLLVAAYQGFLLRPAPAFDLALCRDGIGDLLELTGPHKFRWPAPRRAAVV